MKLCIAEKPSVAREIASIVGANQKKEGYFEGNDYCVTYTFGHLCTLKEPRDYDSKWQRWDIHSMPILPNQFDIKLIESGNYKKQFKIIEKLVSQADEIINCGDAGQEGELIQRWVLYKAHCKIPIKRLWISSLTEEAIKEGFLDLKDGKDFENLYQAGKSRAIGDWLLGLNATRLYTLKFGTGRQVLSVGRVQTPTLAMIVKRQKEIDDFKPQDFWEIETKFKDTPFQLQHDRIFNVEKAQTIVDAINHKEFEIIDYSVKEGKEMAPSLFDLTSLQVSGNKQFGYSAEQTLNTVQSLYEKKVVTYPRVDTTYLSEDIYPKCSGILKGLKLYEEFTVPLTEKKLRKSKKVFNDKKVTDHHAIIPTGKTAHLSEQEMRIYDLITRRFIGVFLPDCVVSNTVVEGQVVEYKFRTSGKQILAPGWRLLYPKGSNVQDDEGLIPVFELGEKGPHLPELLQKKTQAPRYYSEATLLRAMESAGKQVDNRELRELMKENGIGRPSTRASIIETLHKRDYIKKMKKRIEATPIGVALIDTIQNELLKSVELTGEWERKLRLIEKGEYNPETFIEEMKAMVNGLSQDVKNEVKRAIVIQPKKKKQAGELCPKCKEGTILKGNTAFGCNRYGKGCDFLIPFNIRGKKLTEKQILTLIQKGKTGMIKGFKNQDQKIDGKLILTPDFQVAFEAADASQLTCPDCSSTTFLKGKSAFGCSNYKNGCTFKMPFEIVGEDLNKVKLNKTTLKKIEAFYGRH